VRANAGTTVNLLEGCAEHGAGLLYPSTVRAALEPPPDPYGLSKRLGEEACRHHAARATVVRLTSVFGPGQVAWEGATGAIAAFARRAIEGEPIVIPGDPMRVRDFVYADDVVDALEAIAAGGRWGETLTAASGRPTPLLRAAELVRDAVGSGVEIHTPGGELPPGEGEGYPAEGDLAGLGLTVRPIEDAVASYVDWLRRHPAAQGRA
jgi:UDP-glucose 4-epimerase